jgi:hypothetical protein
MATQNFKLLGLALILTAASSCAVSMKMQGNRFESSEVYGKTVGRIDGAIPGQANVELTPDYTFIAPSTTNPAIGATHDVYIGGALGVKDRIELSLNSNLVAHAKFQLLGAPKIRADDGNVSLSVIGSLGYNSDDRSDYGLSNNYYKSHIEYTTYGAQLVAGYRVDRLLNFYAGPFIERGDYKGSYTISGASGGAVISDTSYSGNATNTGGVLGIEIGSPRVSGMIEGAWNHTVSGNTKASYWVGGVQVIVSFGSTKVETPVSEPSSSSERTGF